MEDYKIIRRFTSMGTVDTPLKWAWMRPNPRGECERTSFHYVAPGQRGLTPASRGGATFRDLPHSVKTCWSRVRMQYDKLYPFDTIMVNEYRGPYYLEWHEDHCQAFAILSLGDSAVMGLANFQDGERVGKPYTHIEIPHKDATWVTMHHGDLIVFSPTYNRKGGLHTIRCNGNYRQSIVFRNHAPFG